MVWYTIGWFSFPFCPWQVQIFCVEIFMDALDDRLAVIEQWWRGTFKSISLLLFHLLAMMPYQSCENIQIIFNVLFSKRELNLISHEEMSWMTRRKLTCFWIVFDINPEKSSNQWVRRRPDHSGASDHYPKILHQLNDVKTRLSQSLPMTLIKSSWTMMSFLSLMKNRRS